MLGDIESKPWDYRTLPNKMLELVKNVGDMQQEGTGYFTDSESEMLTILNYLNYGEKTNITDSMIEQIDLAIKTMEGRKLAIETTIVSSSLTSNEDRGTSAYCHV